MRLGAGCARIGLRITVHYTRATSMRYSYNYLYHSGYRVSAVIDPDETKHMCLYKISMHRPGELS